MPILSLVHSLTRRLRRADALMLLARAAALGGLFALLAVAVARIAVEAALAVALVGFACAFVGVRRAKSGLEDPLRRACALLDLKLDGKERVLTLMELKTTEATKSREGLESLIERQLSVKTSAAIAPHTLAPFTPSPALRRDLYSLPFSWGGAALLLIGIGKGPPPLRTEEGIRIREHLAAHPELPKDVRESLVRLERAVEMHASADPEVAEALFDAVNEVAEAERSRAVDSGERPSMLPKKNPSSRRTPLPEEPLPEGRPTPTPLPTHREKEQKREDEEKGNEGTASKPSNANDGANGPRKEDKEGSGSSERNESPKQNDSQKGKGGSKPSEQPGEDGEGEGEGAGQGEGEGSKKDEGGGAPSGKEGKGTGEDGSEGDETGSGGTAGGKEGDERGRGKEEEAGGPEAKGLAETKRMLSEMRGALEKKGDEGPHGTEGRESNETAKGGKERGGRDAEPSPHREEENRSASGDDKPGESPPKGESEKGEGRNGEGEKPQEGSTPAPAPRRAMKDQSSDPSSSRLGGSKTERGAPPASESAKRFIDEGEGTNGGGLSGEKRYKEAAIEGEEEKFDGSHLSREGELVKNAKDARYKTKLDDALLPKPKPAKGGEDQPIPLEYKDLLR